MKGVRQNGQTPRINEICSYCELDRPVFEQCQTLLHPELTPWWSFLLADSAHHKKPHSPTHPTNLGQNRRFFEPHDLEIWQMTLKNNRSPLLYYIKLCASFQSHGWNQTGVTVQKRSIWVKIGNFLSCMTLKFDALPSKTIGHLSYAASSFVHHFVAIGELKLEL